MEQDILLETERVTYDGRLADLLAHEPKVDVAIHQVRQNAGGRLEINRQDDLRMRLASVEQTAEMRRVNATFRHCVTDSAAQRLKVLVDLFQKMRGMFHIGPRIFGQQLAGRRRQYLVSNTDEQLYADALLKSCHLLTDGSLRQGSCCRCTGKALRLDYGQERSKKPRIESLKVTRGPPHVLSPPPRLRNSGSDDLWPVDPPFGITRWVCRSHSHRRSSTSGCDRTYTARRCASSEHPRSDQRQAA